VVLAAAFPAFLYYFVVSIQIDLEAVRLGITGIDEVGWTYSKYPALATHLCCQCILAPKAAPG